MLRRHSTSLPKGTVFWSTRHGIPLSCAAPIRKPSIVVNCKRKKENTLLPPQKTCIRTEATEIKSISTYPAPKALRYLSSPDRKCWIVKRYNLLSGGGCLPPMWGLGFKYRVKGDATHDGVLRRISFDTVFESESPHRRKTSAAGEEVVSLD